MNAGVRTEPGTTLESRPSGASKRVSIRYLTLDDSMSTILPSVLSSPFDPAVHLHSGGRRDSKTKLSTGGYSDDLEALDLQAAEAVTQKTKRGVVIQHRAWRLPEVFRSDGDYQLGLWSNWSPELLGLHAL